MNRFVIISLLIVSIFLPQKTFAQERNKVTGAMMNTVTTIVKVQKEKKEKKVKTKKERRSLEPVKRGWQQSLDLGYNMEFGDSFLSDVGVRYIGGYRAGNTFFIGIGVGADVVVVEREYSYYQDNLYSHFCPAPSTIMLPVFLNMKFYMSKKICQPYFSLSGGARIGVYKRQSLDLYSEYTLINSVQFSRSIYFAEPAFGLSFRASNRSSIYMQVGGLVQSRPYYVRENLTRGKIENRLSIGASFKIGCTF